eukprot:TRINITY_DN5176_c0_g1_i1.p2 TRINITY_DN5176_c0_g1~~TRINITY_DN5176_c0_g1_i1.p2  ORF type:complete len:209 (+),score=66.26 TRINITY_DN5176_c0_g1_i1:139-765(+)
MGGSQLSKEQKATLHKTGFSENEAKALRAAFIKVKHSKTNTELTRDEFKQVFESCAGQSLEGKAGMDLDEIFLAIDTDGSGTVSFDEMIVWLAVFSNSGSEEDKLRYMFKAFDNDGNGVLEQAEVNRLLDILMLGARDNGAQSEEGLQKTRELITHIDGDGDGKITQEEWVQLGKKAGLVRALLGDNFLSVMDDFSAQKKKKKSKKRD